MDDVTPGPALDGIEVDEGLVGDHPGQGQAEVGMLVVVVISTLEVRVVLDGQDLLEEDKTIEDGGPDATRQREDGAYALREIGGEGEGGKSTDRGAGHGMETVDAKVIKQKAGHRGLVRDGDVREGGAIGRPGLRIGRGWSGGAVAAAEQVEAHHEVVVGIDGLAGTDHAVPPAFLDLPVPQVAGFGKGGVEAGDVLGAGEGVKDQDRI